jgi:hypothetical protein
LFRLNSLIPSLEQALEAEVYTLEIAIRSAERQHSGKRTHLNAGPIGGAIAAGITHAVNASSKQEQEAIWATYQNELAMAYEEAAEFYLEQFSDLALTQLDEYASSVESVFIAPPLPEPVELQAMRQRLNERSDALSQLRQQMHTYGHTDKRIYEASPSLA